MIKVIDINQKYCSNSSYSTVLKKIVSVSGSTFFISHDANKILNCIKKEYDKNLNDYQSTQNLFVNGCYKLFSYLTLSLSSRKTISLVFPKFWEGIKHEYQRAFPKFYSHPIGKIIDELPLGYKEKLNKTNKEVTVQDVIDCMQSELSETYWRTCHDSKSFLDVSEKCDEIINNVYLKTFFQMAISLNRFNCIFDNFFTMYNYKGTLMDSSIKHVFTISKMSELLAVDSVQVNNCRVKKGSNVEIQDFSKYLGKFITYNNITPLKGGINQRLLNNRIRLSGFEFFTGQGENTGTTQPIRFDEI